MARKRIKDLDAQASVLDTLKLPVDDTGLAEAKRISISQLDARYGVGCIAEWSQVTGNEQTTFANNNFKKLSVSNAVAGLNFGGCLTTNATGQITNTGSSASFLVIAAVSVSGTNNDDIHLAFAVNGVVVAKSEQSMVLPSGTRDVGTSIQALVTLTTGQYVEVFVKNVSATASVNLGSINVVAQKIG